MKQIIQSYKTGEIKLEEVPVPLCKPGGVLVKNVYSLISVGTEKLMADFARKNILQKAIARPDLVRQVINKVKSDGLIETYKQAMGRLNAPVPLGYSCAGKVIEVGRGVYEFKIGERVACFGSGFASHAEYVFIPKNLCVKIPKNVNYEEAAFVGLGGIALHAVRIAKVSLGDNVVVIGLGLLGLLAVQILKACGCNVLGIDINPEKIRLALELGADRALISNQLSVVSIINEFGNGHGADAIIIFASTKSKEPIELAAEIAREKARIVVPGMIKLDLPRKAFYEKELELVISRGPGPGIYDLNYQLKGIDYPISYVRWTEKRNMGEFLNLISKNKIKIKSLITHRFPISDAEKVYKLILEGKGNFIGVLLQYPKEEIKTERKVILKTSSINKIDKPLNKINVGLIGAGLFAKGTLLPAIKGIKNINLRGIAATTGATAHYGGKKFGFEYCTSDYRDLLNDPHISAIFIVTRHNLHAKLVIEALKAGKHVFVEKPLCLNKNELKDIIQVYQSLITNNQSPVLMVGFNRRFSPFSIKAKEWLSNISEPLAINCRINVGFLPKDSWVHSEEGGGSIIGEVCHFIDLIQYFTNSLPVKVYAETLESNSYQSGDNVIITIKMEDGSVASVTYITNGDKSFPRERIEIFGGGGVCVIENFKKVTFIKDGKRKKMSRLAIDRGHKGEYQTFFNALLKGNESLPEFREYVYTTLATFDIEKSLRDGKPIEISQI